jgi:hypothetical protein
MLMKRLTPSALVVLAPLALAAGSSAAPAQELTDREVKTISEFLADYLDPKSSPGDQEEIKIDLRENLGKIGKKRVEKGEDPVQGALAQYADLGRALMLANDHKKVRGGKVLSEVIETDGAEIAYAVWVPKKYKQTEPTTLLLCIPGTTEGAPTAPDQFLTEHWTDAGVREEALIGVVEMPPELNAWDEIMTEADTPGGLYRVMTTLRALRDTFAIDPNRVYLVGRGEGVEAAMSLASKFPHIFAGVIGQAGDAGEVQAANFRNLPTYLQGSGAQGTAFNDAIAAAEYGNCTLAAEATPAELWAWIVENPRQANPVKVTLRPGTPIPYKAYWIEIPPTEASDITIEAVADRETNTITVTGEGVEAVTIFFNDALVDLSKPVKVVLNGREQEELIPRSVDEMLSLIVRGTSDSGKVYVALRRYDLPG